MRRTICRGCGFAVSPKSAYCPKCGRPSSHFDAASVILIGGLIFFVLAIVIVAVILWRRQSPM